MTTFTAKLTSAVLAPSVPSTREASDRVVVLLIPVTLRAAAAMPPGQTGGWRPCSHEVAPGSTIATALDRYYFCGRTGTVEHQPASMLRLE